jgi:RHS repeat-associated protein
MPTAPSGTSPPQTAFPTAIGSDLYAYDDNGNVVSAPNQIIAYNWQNQPASVTTGTAATVFAYDETGERFLYQTASSTEVQVSEEYLVRGDRYLVGGSAPEITVKLGKTPIGLVTGGAIYSTITDHLGTLVKQVNTSGVIVESTSYGPFGAVLATSGTLQSKRGYTGHEEDADTGLVYAEARYYSPISQRFFQQDPSHVYFGHQGFVGLIGIDWRQILLDPQQLNSYSYVRNNPVTLTDPSGKVIPLLIAVGFLAWDAYDTYETITDPSLSTVQKMGLVGLTLADVSPGSIGAKGTKQIVKHGDELKRGGEILYRSMKEGAEGLPLTGESARTLGVRPSIDIPVDKDGMVHPKTGGISVGLSNPANLPSHRRPIEIGGTGKDPVWCIGSCSLPNGLEFRPDPNSPTQHGFVEPSESMPYKKFKNLGGSTKALWKKWRKKN